MEKKRRYTRAVNFEPGRAAGRDARANGYPAFSGSNW
jgi:hypothetical protein